MLLKGRDFVLATLDTMVELTQIRMSMLCMTHEMGLAKQITDRINFIDAGHILGSPGSGSGLPKQKLPETSS